MTRIVKKISSVMLSSFNAKQVADRMKVVKVVKYVVLKPEFVKMDVNIQVTANQMNFVILELINAKKGCRSNEDCSNGLKCDFNGACRDLCRLNSDCKSTEFCDFITSECKAGCQINQNCRINEFCSFGTCTVAECQIDADCNLNEYCNLERKCLKGCRYNSCDSGYYCSYLNHKCMKNNQNLPFMGQTFKYCSELCKSDEFCDRATGNCTKGCSSKENCHDGLVCNLQIHKCTKGCRSDDDCDENKFCSNLNSQCEIGCRGDYSCKAKEICDFDHSCVPGCITNSHCKLDEFCNGRTCQKNCLKSSCGDNSVCSAEIHEELCSCVDGFFPEKEF